jgi:hypothetical protein
VERRHLFFLLFDCFQANVDCYDALFTAEISDMPAIVSVLLQRAEATPGGKKKHTVVVEDKKRSDANL